MKIATIGDIHGRTFWDQIIPDVNLYDKIVFVADYTDSFTKTNEEIKTNLLRIIQFKLEYSDIVELLLGNHDFSYLYPYDFEASGFRTEALTDLNMIFKQYRELFNIAYAYDNYIWTHAGLTNLFFEKGLVRIAVKYKASIPNTAMEIADFLNTYIDSSYARGIIGQNGISRGGFHMTGGPIWADWKKDLKKDPLNKINQIVGHTETNEYTTINFGEYTITNVDCFMSDKEEKPYIIEI